MTRTAGAAVTQAAKAVTKGFCGTNSGLYCEGGVSKGVPPFCIVQPISHQKRGCGV